MGQGSWLEDWLPNWPDITDQAVLAAMAAVPRHLFVPDRYQAEAYDDVPLPIGEQQTISQPYVVALMTQALYLRKGSRVLEIGTGSGYQTAVLAEITPNVYSVELRPELAEGARRRLRNLGYPVQIKLGDGWMGWPEYAPYDAILVAAAAPEVPPALVAQLTRGGRMVIPVAKDRETQGLWLIKRIGLRLQFRELAEVRFVPLTGPSCPEQNDDVRLAGIRRRLKAHFDRR